MAQSSASSVTFTPTSRAGNTSRGFMPTEDQHVAANKELQRLSETNASKKDMVFYLLEQGWSNRAIADKIRYDSDSARNPNRKAGDPMNLVHVNHIRTEWQAKKAAVKPSTAPIVEDQAK